MIQIIALAISALVGGLLPLFNKIFKPLLLKQKQKNPNSKAVAFFAELFSVDISDPPVPTPYKERIEQTLNTLKAASIEIETATTEINSLMCAKQASIDELEKTLADLSSTESELKKKVEALQNVPLPAVTEFEKLMSKGDKRSAYRDYILFISGVIVSIIVTILLKKFGY